MPKGDSVAALVKAGFSCSVMAVNSSGAMYKLLTLILSISVVGWGE